MYRETNEALSNKVNALRFFAIFGVLYIHAENYAQFGFLQGTQGYALEQKAIGAFEWAVPLFFLLSAFAGQPLHTSECELPKESGLG